MKPLRLFAVLFGLLAISNFLKPVIADSQTGFVFLGRRLADTPNLIAGVAFGLFLSWYSISLWRERTCALPIGIAYAGYVSANLFLFTLRQPAAVGKAMVFGIFYMIFALGGAWGSVAVMVRSGFASLEDVPGRILLRSFALLFALMALSDLLKPFAYTPEVGFVFLGQRLSGSANTIVALVFSGLLAAYAVSIWREKRLALALGTAYALYVVANLVLWSFRKPEGAVTPLVFMLPYVLSAVGVSSGAAYLLWQHRQRLD
jgi:hypothetical protein